MQEGDQERARDRHAERALNRPIVYPCDGLLPASLLGGGHGQADQRGDADVTRSAEPCESAETYSHQESRRDQWGEGSGVESTSDKGVATPTTLRPTRGRTLLVAATGGHLSELVELHGRLTEVEERPLWLVPDSEQSRHLLRGHEVLACPPVEPRDFGALPGAVAVAHRVLGDQPVDCVLSTGAGIAVAVFTAARLRGIACHYIESATRVEGPSLSGRLVAGLPGVRVYSQYPWPSHPRWQRADSVFDGFHCGARSSRAPGPMRVVVTVGTMPFPFPRLLDRLAAVLPPDAEVLWQTGADTARDRSGRHRVRVPAAELEAAMRRADLVVAHAGVGSALTALQAGAFPVLVPRSAHHGEHVDDHQLQIGRALAERGLALCVAPEELTPEGLERATRVAVHRSATAAIGLPLARARRW
jgi:UDP-N-acetylglucosamine--N-acetylmuramyl-(pentapeptide) pyrophosphoryl-undecaprenol N-acetylglucosamine transferase